MNNFRKCTECGKDTDGFTTCYIDNEVIAYLCPDCIENGKDYCLSCGHYSAGQTGFDLHHEGYCDSCWEQIEEDFNNAPY